MILVYIMVCIWGRVGGGGADQRKKMQGTLPARRESLHIECIILATKLYRKNYTYINTEEIISFFSSTIC